MKELKEKEFKQKIKNLLGEPQCEYLNHKKQHRHKTGEECPAVKELINILKD